MHILDEKFKDKASRRAFFAKLRKSMEAYPKNPKWKASDWLQKRLDGGLQTTGYEVGGDKKVVGVEKVKGLLKGKKSANTDRLLERLKKVRHEGVRQNPNNSLPRKTSFVPTQGRYNSFLSSGKNIVTGDSQIDLKKGLQTRNSDVRNAVAASLRKFRKDLTANVKDAKTNNDLVRAFRDSSGLVDKGGVMANSRYDKFRGKKETFVTYSPSKRR